MAIIEVGGRYTQLGACACLEWLICRSYDFETVCLWFHHKFYCQWDVYPVCVSVLHLLIPGAIYNQEYQGKITEMFIIGNSIIYLF